MHHSRAARRAALIYCSIPKSHSRVPPPGICLNGLPTPKPTGGRTSVDAEGVPRGQAVRDAYRRLLTVAAASFASRRHMMEGSMQAAQRLYLGSPATFGLPNKLAAPPRNALSRSTRL